MNKLNLSGVKTATWVRSIMTVIVAVNIFAGYLGWSPLVISESEIAASIEAAIVLITAGVWVWGWWKNNSFTANAQNADVALRRMNGE